MSEPVEATLPVAPKAGTKGGVIQLQNEWVFYFDQTLNKGLEKSQYEDKLKPLGNFATVQEFWRYWNNIDVANFPHNSNLRLFKKNIMPTWEDPENASGGRWIIEVSQPKTTQMWMFTLLAIIGENFEDAKDVCGAVLAIRSRGNTISLWHKSAKNKALVGRLEEDLRRSLKGGKILELKYQEHNTAVDWNTSVVKSRFATTTPAEPKADTKALEPVPTVTPLPAISEDEDDFGSPYHALNDLETKARQEQSLFSLRSSAGATGVGKPSTPVFPGSTSRHRKTMSLSAIPIAQKSSAVGGSAEEPAPTLSPRKSDSKPVKRRRRGKRSSSGSQKGIVDEILSEEEYINDLAASAEAAPTSAPKLLSSMSSPSIDIPKGLNSSQGAITFSPSEQKYLKRKRSIDKSSKMHRRTNSSSSANSDDEGSDGYIPLSASTGAVDSHGKRPRNKFSRSSSRETLCLDEESEATTGGSSFLTSAIVIILCAILLAAYWSQFSCEHWEVNC